MHVEKKPFDEIPFDFPHMRETVGERDRERERSLACKNSLYIALLLQQAHALLNLPQFVHVRGNKMMHGRMMMMEIRIVFLGCCCRFLCSVAGPDYMRASMLVEFYLSNISHFLIYNILYLFIFIFI